MTELKDDLAALRIDRAPERHRGRAWVGWGLALVLLLGAGAASWRWFIRDRPIDVQVATVTERAAGGQAAVLNASGYVTARRRATVSSKITGRVVEVNVEEGRAVREGQVLARLDDATSRASLALAEAQVEASRRALTENVVGVNDARVTLARTTRLLKEGIAAEAEFDRAKADLDTRMARGDSLMQQVQVGERQVELARASLDDTIIRAPFSGVAISKDAQPGEMVSPVSAGGGFTRTGIGTIVDMQSLEIEVDVNEAYIGRVGTGQDVTAVLDAYPDWEIPARVITTVPTADRQKATVLVRIGFRSLDPRMLPDMGVKVTFLRAAAPAPVAAAQPVTLAPKTAVRTEGNASFAFVVSGSGVVEKRAVRIGGADGDRVEVLAGLRPGERVVVAPPPALAEGATVRVQ